MNSELPDVRSEHVRAAVAQAVDLGWLQPVAHGYCFACESEGPVYAVVAEDVPSQPPKCEDCLVNASMKVLADDERMQELNDKYRDGLA